MKISILHAAAALVRARSPLTCAGLSDPTAAAFSSSRDDSAALVTFGVGTLSSTATVDAWRRTSATDLPIGETGATSLEKQGRAGSIPAGVIAFFFRPCRSRLYQEGRRPGEFGGAFLFPTA